MFLLSLAFLAGIAFIRFFNHLPSLPWVGVLWIISAALLISYYQFKRRFVGILFLSIGLLGFGWGLLVANLHIKQTFPDYFEDKQISVVGTILTLPNYQNNEVHFEFSTQQIIDQGKKITLRRTLRLVWYKAAPTTIQVGQQWHLTVKLKQPRGFWDQECFDYQQWLFANRVDATGYVIADSSNQLLSNNLLFNFVNRARQGIVNTIGIDCKDSSMIGLITALAVGVRNNITPAQWKVLQNTGTNHLFAIAGLHIGFVTGLTFFLINYAWRFIPRVALYFPSRQVGALVALTIAIFYSLLAGLSLPTRRAVIMCAVVLYSIIRRKQINVLAAISLAILLLLVVDPLAILSESFWLSFLAVSLIIYSTSKRIGGNRFWHKWGRAQWVLAFGLTPISLLFFQQSSLLSFLANTVAIPWVGFIVLPLCLMGDITWFISAKVSAYFWLFAQKALALIWIYLTYLANLNLFQWHLAINNPWTFILAIAAVILILGPRGFPCRFLGILWFLPLFFCKPPIPATGEVWFTLLDVGQGLAAVIHTSHHVLLYDTGPSFSPNFDAGEAVVIPYLAYSDINKVDTLMISHGDNDHIGGADSILKQTTVQQIFTSVPDKLKPYTASLCYAGQNWNWDGINFRVLYPPYGKDNLDNDSSCVLRIDDGKESILLTGDIERKSEKYLLDNELNLLPATIIVAPHHGSDTSSTPEFVNAVSPRYVLFPTGFDNKFGFPKAIISKRYAQKGTIEYNTANDGEIFIKITANKIESIQTYYRNFWHFWDG